MSADLHTRAQQLLAKERVEGISQHDRDWLSAHLHDCTRCAELARQTDQALRLLRATAIPLPSGLASRTQFRVRLRAQELREREPKRLALWLACAVSWVFGITSAPYVWRILEWIGQSTGAPKLLLEFGFAMWWMVPAVVAAVVLLLENSRQSEESGWLSERK